MQTRPASSLSSVPLRPEGAGDDRVAALAARVDAIESFVRSTTELVDEKSLKELRRTIEALAKRDPRFEQRVTEKVDVLADRIETVAKTASTASAAGAAKDGEIAQLRRELEVSLVRVDAAVQEARRGPDSSELAEVRRSLDELSKLAKQRLPRGLEGRVEELAAKFALVSQRVDSVSSTVSTTAAGLAGRDGDVNALRRAFEVERDRTTAELAELRRGIDTAAMSDLRQAFKELADEMSRRQHSNQNLIGQAGARVDALAGKVDSLSSAVEASASRVSGAEEGLSAFRTYFEDARGRLNALLAEHRQTLATLSTQTTALEEADAETSRVVEERLAEVGEKLDRVAGRLEAAERRNGEAAGALDDRISAASDKIDELVERLDPLHTTLASVTERVEARENTIHALENGLLRAGEKLEGLAGRLEAAEERNGETAGILDDRITAASDSIHGLVDRLEAAEERNGETAGTLDDRITAASDRIDGLVDRLDPLYAAVAAATERAEARDGALEAMEQRFVEANSRVEDLISDLSSALADAPDPERVERVLTARIDEVAGRVERIRVEERAAVDEVSDRLESLTTSFASTARSVSGVDDELSALRSRFTELEQAAGDAGRGLDEHLAGMRSELDERVAGMSSELNRLAARLESSTAAMSSSGARASATEAEVAALREYVEKAGARLSSLVSEHAQSLSALDRRAASLEDTERHALSGLDERLAETVERIDDLSGRVDPLVARASSELGIRIDELAARLRAADEERAESASEIARVAAILEVERASVRTRIDSLKADLETAAGAPATEELERRVARLVTRVEALDAERASAQAQFQAIATALASIPQHFSYEQRLDELSRRLGEVEQRGAAVATKVSHASTLLPTALRSLEARLDEVSPGSRRMTHEPNVSEEPPGPPTGAPEAVEPAASADHTAAVVPLRASDP